MHGYKNPAVHVQYAHTLLMTKFTSRALYAVGFNGQQNILRTYFCYVSGISIQLKLVENRSYK